jgi:flagellar motor component MotA
MKRTTLIGMVAVVAVLACMPLKAAYAYIDPNSAGALYQFLFPLIIAIGSAFAFLRRTIVRACTRIANAVVSVVRGGRAKQAQQRDPPSGHVE